MSKENKMKKYFFWFSKETEKIDRSKYLYLPESIN